MRSVLDIFAQTLRTLWAHKLRSFLTMFGIAWGVGSLLLLVGLGEGFRSGNRKQFDELGENVMFIWGGRAPGFERQFHRHAAGTYLTYRDYKDVLAGCPDIKAVAPVISAQRRPGGQRLLSDQRADHGRAAEFSQIRYLPMEQGRWLNDMDISQKRPVIVIGDESQRCCFPGGLRLAASFC